MYICETERNREGGKGEGMKNGRRKGMSTIYLA